MLHKLTLAYDGAPFAGWQRQPEVETVQETLETAIGRIVGTEVRVVGAGRTDAGVHARGQVAHLESASPIESRALIHGANHYLPATVRVLDARAVRTGFHARKSALGKEYRYRVSRLPVLDPFEARCTLAIRRVDVEAMRAATASLLGRHDFTAFALAGGSHGQPFRTILGAQWHEEGPGLELRIVGDGFLRGMVRGLVGTLLEVGYGKRTPAEFAALLRGRPRGEAGPTAPAHALVLQQVFYDRHWLLS